MKIKTWTREKKDVGKGERKWRKKRKYKERIIKKKDKRSEE